MLNVESIYGIQKVFGKVYICWMWKLFSFYSYFVCFYGLDNFDKNRY